VTESLRATENRCRVFYLLPPSPLLLLSTITLAPAPRAAHDFTATMMLRSAASAYARRFLATTGGGPGPVLGTRIADLLARRHLDAAEDLALVVPGASGAEVRWTYGVGHIPSRDAALRTGAACPRYPLRRRCCGTNSPPPWNQFQLWPKLRSTLRGAAEMWHRLTQHRRAANAQPQPCPEQVLRGARHRMPFNVRNEGSIVRWMTRRAVFALLVPAAGSSATASTASRTGWRRWGRGLHSSTSQLNLSRF